MTVAGAAVATGGVTSARPARTLRPDKASWPIWGFTAGLPVSFLLGVHGVVWMLPAVVFGLRILRTPSTFIPRSTLPLVLYLGWIGLGITMIGPGNVPIFLYRWSLFIGCFTCIVWLVNTSEEAVPTERIVDWLASLWVSLIVLGLLAQVLNTFHQPSPFSLALGPIGRIEFIARISDWKIADFQALGSHQVARPAAPFGAANSWGSAVGILTPFFIRSWFVDASRRRRVAGSLLLLVAAVPIITSVNRGLWISLTLAFVYFTARKTVRGRFGPLVVFGVAMVAVSIAFVATPMGAVVEDRLTSADDSNESRGDIYRDAWHGALDSPLIGNGAPRRTDYYVGSPPVGTHGLIWYLMFCHGFVGLALMGTWMFVEVARSGRPRSRKGWWSHLAVVIALVQIPYYGLLPLIVVVGLAVGITYRDARAERELGDRPVPAPATAGV